MPYGNKQHTYNTSKVINYLDRPVDGKSYWPDSGSERWIRSGTNTSGIRQKTVKKSRDTPPMVWKSVRSSVKTGRKIYVFSKKLGKFVRTNEYFYVQKLVPDYSVFKKKKTRKPPKRFVQPNKLSYFKNKFEAFDPVGVASAKVLSNGGTVSLDGYLLGAIGSNSTRVSFNDGFNLQNYVGTNSLVPSSIYSELDAQALSKLYSKVKAQEVNVAQLLAERKQTIDLINSGVTRLMKIAANLKRGRIGKAFRAALPRNTRELASVPLVVDFGIKPLISDISGLVSEFTKQTALVRVVKSVQKTTYESFIHNTDVSDSTFRCQTQVRLRAEVTVRYVATIEVSSLVLSGASRLGLTNLASIAWELTPWSFVVDWALPIGNYINNADAFWGWRVASVHRTVVTKQTIDGQRTISGRNDNGLQSTGSGYQRFVSESVLVDRVPLTSVPGLPLPRPKNPISLPHAVDALALFNQFSLRKRR